MSGSVHMFRISEDDLAELESNLSLIYREGSDWQLFNVRPDLREAWEMTMKTLSNVRFDYGPPSEVHRIDAGPTEETL